MPAASRVVADFLGVAPAEVRSSGPCQNRDESQAKACTGYRSLIPGPKTNGCSFGCLHLGRCECGCLCLFQGIQFLDFLANQ